MCRQIAGGEGVFIQLSRCNINNYILCNCCFCSVPFPENEYIYEDLNEQEHFAALTTEPIQADIKRELRFPEITQEEADQLLTEEESLGMMV